MSSLVLAAAEHADKTPFYIAGGAFAVWAVLIGVVGITRPAFPNGERGGRAVMLVSVLLMLAAMTSAVATS